MDELAIEPKPEAVEAGSGQAFSLASNWRRKHKAPALVINATTLNTGHNWQFTASFMGWAAQQEITGTGALGPVEAFGLERLEAGARLAGLERVP